MPRMDKLSSYRTTWETGTHGGSVTYVSTKIVNWTAGKVVTLHSGGWQTVTTKRKGDWYVTVFGRSPDGYESASKDDGAVEFPYYDGITFDPFIIRANKAA